MEKEMKKLGLNSSITRTTLDKLNNTEELKNKETKVFTDSTATFDKPEEKRTIKQNNRSYARRMSSIGIVTTQSNQNEFNDFKKIRKYSLDNELMGTKSGKGFISTSFVKSLRRLSLNDAKLSENKPTNGRVSPSLFGPSGSIKTDMSDFYSPSISLHQSNVSRNRTASVFSRNRSSISSYSSALNLPKLSRLSFTRSISSAKQKKKSHNESTSVASKRRVSFGQIDLNNLDNPKLYRYSNSAAYERYKFNPHYYLPDGSLKRKFSLPKLSDTLEAVKNCNYLRRQSIDETADQLEVVNIFKDSKLNATATPTRDLNYVIM